MAYEISQKGFGNLAFQNVENSTINITQQLGKSAEYQSLLKQLDTLKELLSLIPENKLEKRLDVSNQINELEKSIEQLKLEVLRLAETFSRIEINTERLKKAKEFFDNGEFDKSRDVLESEIEQMEIEQAILLKKRNHYEKQTLPQLKHNSEEFLILAVATMFDSKNSELFKKACHYFECSINSFQTKENTFTYAKFLQDYNQFSEAEIYYLQYLERFNNELTLSEKSSGLNNLAILYDYQHEYDKAIEKHSEALYIRKKLAESEPNSVKCLADVSTTLNNLAVIYENKNEFDEALIMNLEALEIRKKIADENKTYLDYLGTTTHNLAGIYYQKGNGYQALQLYLKALKIYEELATTVSSKYQFNYAGTLHNMAVIYQSVENNVDALKTFQDSLKILRKLSESNPRIYLSHLAFTISNIGNTYASLRDFNNAESSYFEALEIYQNLSKVEPKPYIPYIAATLGNLAEFYFTHKRNREKSITYAIETIKLLLPIVRKVPFTKSYLQNAHNLLREWNYFDSEIEKQIALLEGNN